MKTLLITLCAALLVSGCATTGAAPSGGSPPAVEAPAGSSPIVTAPLRGTNADERAVKLAFESFDTLLHAVDALIAAGVIKPGSPRAITIRNALIRTKAALNAAALAQRAGNATSYASAIADAQAAFGQARASLQEIRR